MSAVQGFVGWNPGSHSFRKLRCDWTDQPSIGLRAGGRKPVGLVGQPAAAATWAVILATADFISMLSTAATSQASRSSAAS